MGWGRARRTTGECRGSPGNLRRDRGFLWFWTGQTASQLASQTSQVTIPLVAVVALGSGAAELGVLRAAQQIPVLLFALFVGVWVDRWHRRRVMIVADLGRAVVLGAVPLALMFGVLGMPVLLAVAVAVGVLTVFFDVAYQAYLLQLVSRDQLAQGNGLLESSRSAAQISGPAIGGSLVSLLTAPPAVLASSVFFVVSSFSIARVRQPKPPAGQERPERMFRQIRDGLRVVFGHAGLRTVALTSGAFNFAFAAFLTVYLVFLARDLELPGGAIGLCLAAFGPGALLGSLLAVVLPRRLGYGFVLVSAAVVGDLVLLAVAAVPPGGVATVTVLIAVNVVFGALSQTVNVCVTVVRQAFTPDLLQGRVAATVRFVGLGLAPLGSLAGGLLGSVTDIRISVLACVACLGASPALMVFSPLSRLGVALPEQVVVRDAGRAPAPIE